MLIEVRPEQTRRCALLNPNMESAVLSYGTVVTSSEEYATKENLRAPLSHS